MCCRTSGRPRFFFALRSRYSGGVHVGWRIGISVGVGWALVALTGALCWHRVAGWIDEAARRAVPAGVGHLSHAMIADCVLLGAVATPAGRRHGETRCRKCGYILRGLIEPRCPECGERI